MADVEGRRDNVPVTFTRVPAAALLHAADTGLRVIDALGLVQRTGSTESAINKLREASAKASRA